MVKVEDLKEYYRIPPDLRDLNYEKYLSQVKKNLTSQKNIILIIQTDLIKKK